MNFITGNTLLGLLESHFKIAKDIKIVSAYITMPPISMLLNSINMDNKNITIVGRFSPKDFICGASDFKAIKYLVEENIDVRLLHNLHAKIYQIDKQLIYAGSPNFTSKGLSLIEKDNTEAAVKVPYSIENDLFIQKIINASVKLTSSHIEQMESFIEKLDISDENLSLTDWPETLLTNSDHLFVSDFPFSPPCQYIQAYKDNPQLDFAKIEAFYSNKKFEKAKNLFLKSKAYSWIVRCLKSKELDVGVRFGELSSILHRELCDDPTPFRGEVKLLLANLYLYIDNYSDELEVYTPGKRSEFIRFKR